MSSYLAAKARLKELHTIVETKSANKTLTARDMDAIEAEAKSLNAVIESAGRATRMAYMADATDPSQPVWRGQSTTTRKGVRWNAPSPGHCSEAQLKGLFESARSGAPYRVEIEAKGIPSWDGVSTKTLAPITESGAGGFPSILLPNAFPLPYDPTRLWDHIPVAQMPGPSVEWLQHSGNTNPAAAVAEGAVKPELGMQLTAKTSSAVKIAGIASVSMEALQDFDSFVSFVPSELQAAVVNSETNELINGSGSGVHMRGILNTSGVLTRDVGSDTPLDAIQRSFDDLRVGSAFADPNIVLLSPSTWSYLRREKNTLGSYLLAPDPSTGQVDSIWGVPVIVTTQLADGTAIVMDTNKAIQGWTRLGLAIETNRFGTEEWTKGLVSFRAIERIALGVPRPTAINIVTGLTPPSP